MASAWGNSWGVSWGNSWGSIAVAGADAEPPRKRRKAMYPGGWVPEKLYLPPRRKIKPSTVKALKELYDEVRESVPERLQTGIVPAEVLWRARPVQALPPPADVNFEALARSLETIRVFVAVLEDARKAEAMAEATRTRRRKEEDALIQMLMDVLD